MSTKFAQQWIKEKEAEILSKYPLPERRERAKSINISHFECSAKNNTNIESAFECMTRTSLNYKNMISMDLEEFQMELIDFGLEEFEVHNDICNVLCDFDKFGVMQDQLANISIDVKSASIERIPNELKELSLDKALKILNVIDKFEENDDVQKVFHNLSITENIIKELNK